LYPSITVTIPKEILSDKIVQDSIAQVMVKKTAPEVKFLFKKTMFGWANKPTFRQALTRRTTYIAEEIWADGVNAEQYERVNAGASPHPIPSSGTTFMRFRWGGRGSYKASSSPRIIQSKRHSQSGGVVTMFKVNHPGFPAREFDQAIAEEYAPTFRKDIQDAIGVAAAKSNK